MSSVMNQIPARHTPSATSRRAPVRAVSVARARRPSRTRSATSRANRRREPAPASSDVASISGPSASRTAGG